MRHYVVTGGCGFIGSHLVEALVSTGHRVTIVDDLSTGNRTFAHRDAELVIGDVRDATVMNDVMADADGCFHLAAIASVERSRTDWRNAHTVNIGGTVNVLEAAAKQPRKPPVVLASSAAVYGDQLQSPLSEHLIPTPQHAYGIDKLSGEWHARIAWHLHQVPTMALRFFNVYGPRQVPTSPYSGVISIFAHTLMQHKPLTIHGDGQQTRDFIYVGDVVAYLVAAMQRCNSQQVLNICTGQATSITTLAETIATITNTPLEVANTAPRQGDIRHSVGNATLARTVLGIAPLTPLAEGLRYTLAALRDEV